MHSLRFVRNDVRSDTWVHLAFVESCYGNRSLRKVDLLALPYVFPRVTYGILWDETEISRGEFFGGNVGVTELAERDRVARMYNVYRWMQVFSGIQFRGSFGAG